MDVVVVGAADDDAGDVVVDLRLGVRVDLLEVREGLEDRLPIRVILGLDVGPLRFGHLRRLLLVARVSVHHPC